MDTYKQILLLGNGINRCFNANSWESLLLEIATNNKAKNGKIYFYDLLIIGKKTNTIMKN